MRQWILVIFLNNPYKEKVMNRWCLQLTFFLAASRGGFTPFISRLFNSLDKNVFFRWMLMNPKEIVHIGEKNYLCVYVHTHIKTY